MRPARMVAQWIERHPPTRMWTILRAAYRGYYPIERTTVLQLSENAAAALENIRESQGIPEEQGTRLTAEDSQAGGLALRLEFVDDVPDTDELVEQSGTEIHLDSRVVEPLQDTVMDVKDSEEGLAFVFRGQDQ